MTLLYSVLVLGSRGLGVDDGMGVGEGAMVKGGRVGGVGGLVEDAGEDEAEGRGDEVEDDGEGDRVGVDVTEGQSGWGVVCVFNHSAHSLSSQAPTVVIWATQPATSPREKTMSAKPTRASEIKRYSPRGRGSFEPMNTAFSESAPNLKTGTRE